MDAWSSPLLLPCSPSTPRALLYSTLLCCLDGTYQRKPGNENETARAGCNMPAVDVDLGRITLACTKHGLTLGLSTTFTIDLPASWAPSSSSSSLSCSDGNSGPPGPPLSPPHPPLVAAAAAETTTTTTTAAAIRDASAAGDMWVSKAGSCLLDFSTAVNGRPLDGAVDDPRVLAAVGGLVAGCKVCLNPPPSVIRFIITCHGEDMLLGTFFFLFFLLCYIGSCLLGLGKD